GIRDFHVTGVQTCALPISLVRSQVLYPTELQPPEGNEDYSGAFIAAARGDRIHPFRAGSALGATGRTGILRQAGILLLPVPGSEIGRASCRERASRAPGGA